MDSLEIELLSEARRIEITSELLFESLLGGRWYDLGFFQLSNRLLLGLNGKYVLRFFGEHSDLPGYKFLLHTTLHDYVFNRPIKCFLAEGRISPEARDEILSRLREANIAEPEELFRKKTWYSLDHENDPSWVDFDANGGRSVFRRYWIKIDPVRSTPESFDAHGRDQISALSFDWPPPREGLDPRESVGHFVRAVLDDLKAKCRKTVEFPFETAFDEIIGPALEGARVRHNNQFIPHRDEPWRSAFMKVHAETKEAIRDFYEEEYCRFKDSPLISRFKGFPARLLFHRKIFTRTSPRFQSGYGYHFDADLIIPPTQRREIEYGLRLIAETVPEESMIGDEAPSIFSYAPTWKWPPRVEDDGIVVRPRFKGACDSLFWTNIRYRPDEFFRILEAPLNPLERLFVDPCLASGVLQFRGDVLGSKTTRSENDQFSRTTLVQSIQSDRDSELRAMCYHYLMCILSTSSKSLCVNSMSVPLRLNGAPFGAITTVFGARDQRDMGVGKAEVFERNWRFYRDIAVRMNRALRKKLKHLYLDQVTEALVGHWYHCRSANDRTDFRLLNQLLEDLQRVFPFGKVVLGVTEASPSGGNVVPLRPDYALYRKGIKNGPSYGYTDNEFFSRFGEQEYIKPTDIIQCWREAIGLCVSERAKELKLDEFTIPLPEADLDNV